MASLCLSTLTLSITSKTPGAVPSSAKASSSNMTTSLSYRNFSNPFLFSSPEHIHRRAHMHIVRMAPDEEKLTRRNPLDFPIEWDRPKPGRRPDIFPQFSPMKTPLPPPLPYDPPEEDEEEEEEKKEENEEEEDPDKEEPDKQGNQ